MPQNFNLIDAIAGPRSKKFVDLTQKLYQKNVELLKQKIKDEIILDTVSEGIVDTDENLNISLLNNSAKQILFSDLKYDTNLYTGKNFFSVVQIKTKSGEWLNPDEIMRIRKFEKDNYLMLEVKSKIKYIYLNISDINIDNEKKNYIISIRDITAEKELEKTKEDFISVTSHELRTPMTIIKSYLWMLGNENKGTLNEKQRDYLEKALKGSERMLSLINDTLNISRIEQGRIEFKMEMVNFYEILDEVTTDFKVKTDEKKIYLKVEKLTEQRIDVFGDRTKIREIITNFLGNSVKFTKEGGITVKVENQDNGFIKCSVIDTGRGITEEDIPKLFHKFGRLDNSYQTVAESGGTGLGLYIVKSLVAKMGGSVGVMSDGSGKGSTFWFTLSKNIIDKAIL